MGRAAENDCRMCSRESMTRQLYRFAPQTQRHASRAAALAAASHPTRGRKPPRDRKPPGPRPRATRSTAADCHGNASRPVRRHGSPRNASHPSAAASRHGTASHPAHGRKPPRKRKPPPLDAVRVATGMQAAPAGTAQTAPVPKPRTCRARLLCVERAFYGNEMQRLPFMAEPPANPQGEAKESSRNPWSRISSTHEAPAPHAIKGSLRATTGTLRISLP